MSKTKVKAQGSKNKNTNRKKPTLENTPANAKGVKKKNIPALKNTTKQNGESVCANGTSTGDVNKTARPLNAKSKSTVKKEDIDSNWKKLAATLEKPKKKRIKPANSQQGQNEIWFDDVDDVYLEKDCSNNTASASHLVKPNSFSGTTKTIAMDCEMVGVGMDGETSVVARVSIVNQFGNCIYDKYVQSPEEITDYRTAVSGIRPSDLEKGESFEVIQKEVSSLLSGRTLVGHALRNDLKVLYLSHPRKRTRDTAKFKKFRSMFNGRTPSLRNLTERLLGVKIQGGEHSSVQDAQAAMRLYVMHKKEWEATVKNNMRFKKKADEANDLSPKADS